jgi:hypothetical protein
LCDGFGPYNRLCEWLGAVSRRGSIDRHTDRRCTWQAGVELLTDHPHVCRGCRWVYVSGMRFKVCRCWHRV